MSQPRIDDGLDCLWRRDSNQPATGSERASIAVSRPTSSQSERIAAAGSGGRDDKTSAYSMYLDGAVPAELEDASVNEKRAYEFARIFRLKPTPSDILPPELTPNTPAASTSVISKPLEFETALG